MCSWSDRIPDPITSRTHTHPSIFKLLRKHAAFVRVLPTFAFIWSRERGAAEVEHVTLCFDKLNSWSYKKTDGIKLNDEYRSSRELCTSLMFVAYVKWQFVNFKDFSRYPFLFPQLASDTLQNVPFCSGQRGLQGHVLLAAATPSPRQLYFQPSPATPEPLPGW